MNREALLQAILAAPDDRALRLVFADWLDEQHDPLDHDQAEFIRLDLRLAELSCDDRDYSDLHDRYFSLRWQHREAWFGGLLSRIVFRHARHGWYRGPAQLAGPPLEPGGARTVSGQPGARVGPGPHRALAVHSIAPLAPGPQPPSATREPGIW
jgi:uncharacterized protein (TIGR02996 family)